MKRITIAILLSFSLAILVRAQDYRITNIGSLGGPAVGYALSPSGEVLGESEIYLGSDQHAFQWSRQWGIFDIDAFVGQHLNTCDLKPCEGKNSHQASVGYYGDPAAFHAFLWNAGSASIQDLGTLGGRTSVAIGINDAYEVVGGADLPSGLGHAFLWSPVSQMQDLDGSPDYASYAVAINNLHQVAGVRDHGQGVAVVFLWTPDAGLQELGFQGRPYSINDNGEMVGRLDPVGHAFYWAKSTGLLDLGALSGDSYSEAVGINNQGQVVGTSTSSAKCTPFMWTATGGMKPLPPMSGRWYSAAINDAGQVLVNHYFGRGHSATKLLTPLMHVALASSTNPSKAGDPVTFTATVSSVQWPVHGGIMFKIDKKLYQVGLNEGQAVLTTATLSPGTHTVTAKFMGDLNYYPSTSNVIQQVVNP